MQKETLRYYPKEKPTYFNDKAFEGGLVGGALFGAVGAAIGAVAGGVFGHAEIEKEQKYGKEVHKENSIFNNGMVSGAILSAAFAMLIVGGGITALTIAPTMITSSAVVGGVVAGIGTKFLRSIEYDFALEQQKERNVASQENNQSVSPVQSLAKSHSPSHESEKGKETGTKFQDREKKRREEMFENAMMLSGRSV
ncbi:MAG: hypothetical protein R3D71_09225 [Rickettsiales bacterium]